MAIEKSRRYTADEFFQLVPETNTPCELYNGEIIDLASTNTLHQRMVSRMLVSISNFITQNKGKCEVFPAPYDVKLNFENVVQPDIFVVCDPNKLDDKRCNGAPDLVIEITSTNHYHDYYRKFHLYKNFGVREYWIIDPEQSLIHIYGFEDGSSDVYTFEQSVPVGIFGGELKINLKELLGT